MRLLPPTSRPASPPSIPVLPLFGENLFPRVDHDSALREVSARSHAAGQDTGLSAGREHLHSVFFDAQLVLWLCRPSLSSDCPLTKTGSLLPRANWNYAKEGFSQPGPGLGLSAPQVLCLSVCPPYSEICWKESQPQSQRPWVPILAPLGSCVTLGKLPNLSELRGRPR